MGTHHTGTTVCKHTMNCLLPLAFIILCLQEATGQCDSGAYVYKSHSWYKWYVAKLYLDQSWLAQQTSDWTLSITFSAEVQEFKVWDADILNPTPTLYSCQFLELSFMVRYPEGVSDELSTDYDVVAVTETVNYNDGASGDQTYCPPMAGQPTTPA